MTIQRFANPEQLQEILKEFEQEQNEEEQKNDSEES